VQRVDWLLGQGVKTIHFCGGEPTIHPDLPLLLRHVQAQGGKTKLTTNGIAISSELISALRAANTQVKVSLHGDHDQHNAMVGRDAFDQTTNNLRRLVAAGVSTSVQTTVIAGGSWVVDWVIQFCLEIGVRRLSILPFIPRGSGRNHRDDYGLSLIERRLLREHVTQQRRALNTRLDLRWLDFTARPFHVVEPDCFCQSKRDPFTSEKGTHLRVETKKQQPERGPGEERVSKNNSQNGAHRTKITLVRRGSIPMLPCRRGRERKGGLPRPTFLSRSD
jgi:molybdenum cofactor biosynthesis enzyme MoaA